MTDLIVVPQATQWQKLKALVLDSVSSPITKRVYNLGLDEFFEWFTLEPRAGFTKATVAAWRVALEARGLGAVSINVRITAVRKLAVEAADNGLLAPELAAGIARVKSVKSMGVRTGNWLSLKQAQALLNAPDITTTKGLRDRGIIAVLIGCGLRRSEVAGVGGRPLVQRRTSGGKGESRPVAGSEPSAVQKTYVCCTPPEDSSSSNVCNKGTFAAHLQRTEFCRSRAEKSDFGKVYLRRDQVLLIPLCSTA